MTRAYKMQVWLTVIGKFGGDQVTLGRASAPLAELAAIYRGAFADTFA